MKKPINQSVLTIGITILMAAGIIGTASAAEQQAQQKPSTENEFPFDKVGTVTKHDVDMCMAGINYKLYSAVKAPLHKTIDQLAAASKSDQAILDKASKNGSLVQVRGTMMVGVEANCKWVKVSSVTPVSRQNKP
jgi:hypothetical protein